MKKRIGLLCGDIHFGLAYQRGHIFMRHLRDEYEFVLMSFPDMGKADLHYLDAVIVFHAHSKQAADFIYRAKRQYGIKVIVDCDDLLDNLPSDHPDYIHFKNSHAAQCVSHADHFVTSTTYIQKTWGHLNKNITVIENCIDEKRYEGYDGQPKPYKAGFVVGWTGSQTHRPDLYSTGFIEGLARAMRKCDDMRAHFHVLCPQTLLDEFGVRVTYNPTVVDYLDWPAMCFTLPFDLCAVPLADHPFNDAKSDLRLLDMAPFQVPCLASPRDQFLRHQDQGSVLLVEQDTPEHWEEALVGAYENQEKVRQVGIAANQYVMQARVAHIGAEKWRQLLHSLLS